MINSSLDDELSITWQVSFVKKQLTWQQLVEEFTAKHRQMHDAQCFSMGEFEFMIIASDIRPIFIEEIDENGMKMRMINGNILFQIGWNVLSLSMFVLFL